MARACAPSRHWLGAAQAQAVGVLHVLAPVAHHTQSRDSVQAAHDVCCAGVLRMQSAMKQPIGEYAGSLAEEWRLQTDKVQCCKLCVN